MCVTKTMLSHEDRSCQIDSADRYKVHILKIIIIIVRANSVNLPVISEISSNGYEANNGFNSVVVTAGIARAILLRMKQSM